MSILTPTPRDLPWYARVFFAIPIVGWMARDVAFGSRDNIYYALVTIFAVWVVAIKMFGIVALYLPMVGLVPLYIILLIMITLG